MPLFPIAAPISVPVPGVQGDPLDRLPAGVTSNNLRYSYTTGFLRLGAALQDVFGQVDPRTTWRYDRSRHNVDRSPDYLLAAALTSEDV